MKINLQSLEQLRQDVGDEVYPLIVAQFCEELEQCRTKLAAAVVAADKAAIAELAHSLKSTARTVGLESLSDLAEQAENDARAGAEDAIDHAQQLIELSVEGQQELGRQT